MKTWKGKIASSLPLTAVAHIEPTAQPQTGDKIVKAIFLVAALARQESKCPQAPAIAAVSVGSCYVTIQEPVHLTIVLEMALAP